jgi:hypothetical protein
LNIETFFAEEENVILATLNIFNFSSESSSLNELYITTTNTTAIVTIVVPVVVKTDSMIRDVAGVAIAIEDIQLTMTTELTETIMFMFPFWSSKSTLLEFFCFQHRNGLA